MVLWQIVEETRSVRELYGISCCESWKKDKQLMSFDKVKWGSKDLENIYYCTDKINKTVCVVSGSTAPMGTQVVLSVLIIS
uniref:Ovule protein n=1 Tax=Steinernema glaseri TaxID=37863 RepID=A0A1I8AVM0_9BILA